jgi:hypothetical protein
MPKCHGPKSFAAILESASRSICYQLLRSFKKLSEALKQAKNILILGQQSKKSSTESIDIF